MVLWAFHSASLLRVGHIDPTVEAGRSLQLLKVSQSLQDGIHLQKNIYGPILQLFGVFFLMKLWAFFTFSSLVLTDAGSNCWWTVSLTAKLRLISCHISHLERGKQPLFCPSLVFPSWPQAEVQPAERCDCELRASGFFSSDQEVVTPGSSPPQELSPGTLSAPSTGAPVLNLG